MRKFVLMFAFAVGMLTAVNAAMANVPTCDVCDEVR
jgi:hypothetical protein